MTFIFTTKPTFTAPVVAELPADGGKTQKISFSVVFKALTKPEVDSLMERVRASAEVAKKGELPPLKDSDVLEEILVGFGPDLLEENRQPMAFSKENVQRLCSAWKIEPAIVKSFFDNFINAGTKN
jgi:hypothetical protein